jgi:hypothetical protein
MFDKLFQELIEKLASYGLPAILILLLVLIVQNPDRAEKLKLLIVTPFFKLLKWFGRSYVKSSLTTKLNKFFEKNLSDISNCGKQSVIKFTIDLSTDRNDVIKKNGKLIIRFKETDDQSQNLLLAAKIALPTIICPHIRPNIDSYVTRAIDLAFLKKLADNIDNHAKLVFTKHFLSPEIAEDQRINDLLRDLISIDRKGFFVSIFINELNYVGEGIYADSDKLNRTDEVIKFLDFLLAIANREVNEINELQYSSSIFGVGVILLARSGYASAQGVNPYLKRLRKNFYIGCNSVYIVAFPKSWDFFARLINSINKDNRFDDPNVYRLSENRVLSYESLKIAIVRFNRLFFDTSLESHLSESGINVGCKITGKVIDVSVDVAVISFNTLTGHVKRSEVDWNTCLDCRMFFSVGSDYDFLIKDIDMSTGNIELTRRFNEDDPWIKSQIPIEGEIISVVPTAFGGLYLICMYGADIEVKLPLDELSWVNDIDSYPENLIGKFIDVKVIYIDEKNRTIRVSKRQVIDNPWPQFKNLYSVGISRTGQVVKIEDQIVTVEIDPGIFGRITSNSFRMAGYEYENHKENLVIGQKLDVVVKKVWAEKKKISLELKRNYDILYPSRKGNKPVN